MADSSSHSGPQGYQDLLPSPRHIPLSEDQRSGTPSNPVNEDKDKITIILRQMRSLQDQIEEIQNTAKAAQVDEPFEKRIRVVLDDHKTHLLEIKSRMQEREITHNHQMSRLKENMDKAQQDIQYLLEKTRALEEGVSPADQPRRTMDRAASGQKLNLLRGSSNLFAEPSSAHSGLPPKPLLLLSNTSQTEEDTSKQRPPPTLNNRRGWLSARHPATGRRSSHHAHRCPPSPLPAAGSASPPEAGHG